jgi:hypothetical protein
MLPCLYVCSVSIKGCCLKIHRSNERASYFLARCWCCGYREIRCSATLTLPLDAILSVGLSTTKRWRATPTLRLGREIVTPTGPLRALTTKYRVKANPWYRSTAIHSRATCSGQQVPGLLDHSRSSPQARIPNSEVVLLEEGSHIPVLEQRDEASDAIEDWPEGDVDAARAASVHLPRQWRPTAPVTVIMGQVARTR